MKKITEIYKEYKIMPNLQMHQYRVSAVAMQICESLDIDINKENIISACLLHDMGNIIKFDLNHFPEFNKPEGIEYWQKVKDEYILKYGKNEHKASMRIAKELNVNADILYLIESVDSSFVEILANSNDLERKICMYSDGRVTPHGIVSIKERSEEAKERYKNHEYTFNEENVLFFNKNLTLMEKKIFSHSKIKKEDINDESVIPYLEILKNFSI